MSTTSLPPARTALPARSHRLRTALVLVAGVLAIAGALDLWAPIRNDIRVFDAAEVARLDTDMWRSYYGRKPLLMFVQLGELMRRQFHFPWLRSYVVAAHAARAAFVFKQGASHADYARALPDLRAYFGAIRRVSTTPFDVERAAQLELQWWIVHRERSRRHPAELDQAVADAASALYEVPAPSLAVYGHERSVAMTIRDSTQEAGGVSERNWQDIRRHLDVGWASLENTIRP